MANVASFISSILQLPAMSSQVMARHPVPKVRPDMPKPAFLNSPWTNAEVSSKPSSRTPSVCCPRDNLIAGALNKLVTRFLSFPPQCQALMTLTEEDRVLATQYEAEGAA